MAVKGGYEPFAVDVDAPAAPRPKRRSSRQRTASSSTTCPLRPRRSSIRRTRRRSPRSPTAGRRRTASPSATEVAGRLIALRADDGFRAPVTYTPPDPPIPGRLAPDGALAADRHLPRADAAVQPRLGRPVPAGRAAGALDSRTLGARLQRGQGDRLEHEHDADRRADAGGAVLGGAARAAGTWLLPQVRPGPRTWTSSARHGSWR